MTELQKTLFSLSDEKYKEFFSPLVPNIDNRRIIGVRTPQLKALAKQYDSVLPYFAERMLQPFVHNKAIQKAVESRRVGDERKAFLRILKY